MVRFTPITAHRPGTVFALLSQSYQGLWETAPQFCEQENEGWADFDRAAFENPDTVGACVFITCLDAEVVGLGSWDPRQGPALGIVGHNCVLPSFRGKGYGKKQIREILRRLKEQGFKKATASTGEHPFFEPARRMYEACGFRETGRSAGRPDRRYGIVRYEIELGGG